MNKIKSTEGITLISLVITIIILLILAGITISQLSESRLFKQAELAKQNTQSSQELENKTLTEYGDTINTYIDSSNRDTSKSESIYTLLWEGSATSGEITFLNNHKFSEFDAIKFRCIENSDNWYGNENEISIESINELIGTNKAIGLYGYTSRNVSIKDFTDNGFTIYANDVYILHRVYGVKYK